MWRFFHAAAGGPARVLTNVTIVAIMSFLQRFEPSAATAICAGLLALLAAGALVARRGRIAGTTLLAPWCWALIAVVAVAGTEVLLGLGLVGVQEAGRTYYRFAAAAATYCPLMAVLGAKRPQDRGWQFIVASLWLVLAWPAISGMLLRPAGELHLHAAWQWFVLALCALGAFNCLPTRHAGAAALAGLGQLLLVAAALPPFAGGWLLWLVPDPNARAMLGLALGVAAILAWAGRSPRKGSTSLDRVWLDFRDGFGAVWALRVLERFNAAAVSNGWNVRLHWKGLTAAEAGSDLDEEALAAARHTLRQLLRRFVSTAGLAEHSPGSALESKPDENESAPPPRSQRDKQLH